MKRRSSVWRYLFVLLFISGCAGLSVSQLQKKFGPPAPVERKIAELDSDKIDYWSDVEPVLARRCVVCHACYDAPCQLKLTAIEGVERGASKESVYNLSRPLAAAPSRLEQDAATVAAWRKAGFHPVLNEYQQSPLVNQGGSLMYQLLTLKEAQPFHHNAPLPESVPVGIKREHSCPKIEDYPKFARQNPDWGMPYGLPPLAVAESIAVKQWLVEGAQYTPRPPVDSDLQKEIEQWESFFNKPSLKAQLMSRYLYEHLFLANLYFSEYGQAVFFRLVRSKTPPGEPVQLIVTRRPYDDPGVARVYYRLVPQIEVPAYKNHMPYALDAKRMANWMRWFLLADYSVKSLPGFDPVHAANPFYTFAQIPSKSRYQFLLDEAQYTIMTFIKGPVCRGQVAVNVIRDHFWVFFVAPETLDAVDMDKFLADNYQDFQMPNADGDIYLPMVAWNKYADKQHNHLKKRDQFLAQYVDQMAANNLAMIWDGDGENANAALTVYRHFDNAAVHKGLVGPAPKTAWVIDYGLLERIYYLLVAGYDVYGNVGHQLLSRIYMDFLRMEGETNFLYFLPQKTREMQRLAWYQGAEDKALNYMNYEHLESLAPELMTYATNDPKKELYTKLQSHLAAVYTKKPPAYSVARTELLTDGVVIKGAAAQYFPEFSIVEVSGAKESRYYSLVLNNDHKNVSTLFNEKAQLDPSHHQLSLVSGVVGYYPNAFFSMTEESFASFIQQAQRVSNAPQFATLFADYGVRRTSPDFWPYSDRLHAHLEAQNAIAFGWLDYNRLENR